MKGWVFTNDNVSRLAESVKQLAESKADAEEPKALIASSVELMQGNYLSKSEVKIGAGVMTAVITVIGLYGRFNCELWIKP